MNGCSERIKLRSKFWRDLHSKSFFWRWMKWREVQKTSSLNQKIWLQVFFTLGLDIVLKTPPLATLPQKLVKFYHLRCSCSNNSLLECDCSMIRACSHVSSINFWNSIHCKSVMVRSVVTNVVFLWCNRQAGRLLKKGFVILFEPAQKFETRDDKQTHSHGR